MDRLLSRFELDFGSVLNPWNDNSLPMTPPHFKFHQRPMRFAVIFAGGEGSTLRGNISSLALVADTLAAGGSPLRRRTCGTDRSRSEETVAGVCLVFFGSFGLFG